MYETIRFACGCERQVELTGNRRQREQRAAWLRQQVCLVCQRAQAQAEQQQQQQSEPQQPQQQQQAVPHLYARLVGGNGRVQLQLTVHNGYAVREELKRRGWRYDGGIRVWQWQTAVASLDDVRRILCELMPLGIQPMEWLAGLMNGEAAQAEAAWARASESAQWMTMHDARQVVSASTLEAAIVDGRVRRRHAGPLWFVHREDVQRLAEEVSRGSDRDQ